MTCETKPFDWCPNIAEDLVDAVMEKLYDKSVVLNKSVYQDAVRQVEEVLLARTPFDPQEHIEHFEPCHKVREDGRQFCFATQSDEVDVANLKRCPYFAPLGDTEEDDNLIYCSSCWVEDKVCVCTSRPINSKTWRW